MTISSQRPALLAAGVGFSLLILTCGEGAEENDAGVHVDQKSGQHAAEPHAREQHHGQGSHEEHMHNQEEDLHGHGTGGPMSHAALSGTVDESVRVIAVKARRYEFDPSPIVVRSGEKVRLEVTSEDVTHGIEIQGHDINKKLPPVQTATVPFPPSDPGTYHTHCSKYCGPGHEDMHAELIVRENES